MGALTTWVVTPPKLTILLSTIPRNYLLILTMLVSPKIWLMPTDLSHLRTWPVMMSWSSLDSSTKNSVPSVKRKRLRFLKKSSKKPRISMRKRKKRMRVSKRKMNSDAEDTAVAAEVEEESGGTSVSQECGSVVLIADATDTDTSGLTELLSECLRDGSAEDLGCSLISTAREDPTVEDIISFGCR